MACGEAVREPRATPRSARASSSRSSRYRSPRSSSSASGGTSRSRTDARDARRADARAARRGAGRRREDGRGRAGVSGRRSGRRAVGTVEGGPGPASPEATMSNTSLSREPQEYSPRVRGRRTRAGDATRRAIDTRRRVDARGTPSALARPLAPRARPRASLECGETASGPGRLARAIAQLTRFPTDARAVGRSQIGPTPIFASELLSPVRHVGLSPTRWRHSTSRADPNPRDVPPDAEPPFPRRRLASRSRPVAARA